MTARYCPTCDRKDHHDRRCPEMFWKGPDGKPDFNHPRGVHHPGDVPPPGPLRSPRPRG